jgi:XRE family transcriptional regulator
MNKLKELRKKEGLTQEELAKEIGVSKITILRWENGERQIKPDKIQQLADYFMVSKAYLLGYSDYKTPSREDLNQNSFKENFINSLTIHDLVLSNDEIDNVIDLIQSLSTANKFCISLVSK